MKEGQEYRDIREIVNELEKHPEFVYTEVYTWTDIINELNDGLKWKKGKESTKPKLITYEELTYDQKEIIIDKVIKYITGSQNFYNLVPEIITRDENLNLEITSLDD